MVGIKYIIRENKHIPADRGKHRLVRCSVNPSLRRDEKAGMFLWGRGHEIKFSHRARRMSLGRAEAAAAWEERQERDLRDGSSPVEAGKVTGVRPP